MGIFEKKTMIRFLKYGLVALGFLFLGLMAGFRLNSGAPKGATGDQGQALKKFYQAFSFIDGKYVEVPDNDALINAAMEGMMSALDPHSSYIPPADNSEIQERMEGSFDGIGVQFNLIDDTIYVEATITGGPSEQLGIRAGDRIIKVDDKTVAGTKLTNADVMSYLKGPRGTEVKVSILRHGQSKLIDFNITRDKIPFNSLEFSYMIRPEVGYIRVSRFAETTYAEFMEAMTNLRAQGMKDLILDLRGNPGGYLTMACKMADEFLSEGQKIVSTDGRIPESKEVYTATGQGVFEKGKIIVLQDYGSASASEIVAGALQDHDRGLIVGIRSFGKGLVQVQEDFEDGSAIRIVIAKYYTPSGRCIQKPYHKTAEEYEHEIVERFESGEIYDPSKVVFPDSLKFKTDEGRTVYGGGGIFPDVFVAGDTTQLSVYLGELDAKDIFRLFVNQYIDNRPQWAAQFADANAFIKNYQVDAAMMGQFTAFATGKGVKLRENDLRVSRALIENRLKAYLGRRLYNEAGFYPVIHAQDHTLQRSLELLPDVEALLKK